MLGEKINFGDLVAWEKARSELKKEQEYISDEHIQKDALGNAIGGYYEVVPLEEKADIAVTIEIMKYQQYLSETDWYVIRNQETGAIIPENVLQQRGEARERISALREEI